MTSILKVSTLKDPTNSNTALSIDSSGRILTPARPAFRAFLDTATGNTDFTSSSPLTTLNFDTVAFNIGNHFDLSTNEFTAPVSGLYQINCHLVSGSATAVTTARLEPYINDGAMTGDATSKEDPQGGGKYSLTYNHLLQLSANDRLEFRHLHLSDNTVSIEYAEFSGFLVG